MNLSLRPSLAVLAFGLCTALPALAQVAPADNASREPVAPRDRVERITHEDKLTRIEEVRKAGQTQSIDVQPKNGAPAYQIQPDNGTGDSSSKRNGTAGRSSWRILNF